MDVDGKTSPGHGRRLDPALDDRLLDEVLAQLGTHGYAQLTFDELAARSGVTRTTILRR